MGERLIVKFWLIAFSLFLFASCATVPELNTHYDIPPSTGDLKGKRIALVVEDNRGTRDLLGSGAREEFKYFTGRITFSIARPGEAGFRLGPYDVQGMVKEAFKRRLQWEGVVLANEKDGDAKTLFISIDEMSLDLDGRMWRGKMSYQAKVLSNGRISSKESVSGQAERAKILGRKGADEVMSDMLTDLVNRLDLKRLFKEAGI